jgi:small nuclear ribonucleoprotein (snRNP)-like protein
MDEMQAIRYLESLIGQTLRVHTTDTRMFVGTFKCTDAVSAP